MISVSVQHTVSAFDLAVSFDFEHGATALFGRSGSGKTTLVDLIAGLKTPENGEINVDGCIYFSSDTGINLPTEQRRVGYVFQDSKLFPHLTVAKNISYGCKSDPPDGAKMSFSEVVDFLDVRSFLDRAPNTLSGGEKQRVAMARALLSAPRCLLMDEPLASLGGGHKQEILSLLTKVKREIGIPLVYVSHNIEEILQLIDNVVVLSHGRVLTKGTIEDVVCNLDKSAAGEAFQRSVAWSGRVTSHDRETGLACLETKAGPVLVPADSVTEQQRRVFIPARNVSLSITDPKDTSILNIVSGPVVRVDSTPDSASIVEVEIDAGLPLYAHITRFSAEKLGIQPGMNIFASFKAVTFDD